MTEINLSTTQPSLWTTVRQSIAGSHRGEYTDGAIGRAILLLAIPTARPARPFKRSRLA